MTRAPALTPEAITGRLQAALTEILPAGTGLDTGISPDMLTVTVPAARLAGRAGLRPGRAGL